MHNGKVVLQKPHGNVSRRSVSIRTKYSSFLHLHEIVAVLIMLHPAKRFEILEIYALVVLSSDSSHTSRRRSREYGCVGQFTHKVVQYLRISRLSGMFTHSRRWLSLFFAHATTLARHPSREFSRGLGHHLKVCSMCTATRSVTSRMYLYVYRYIYIYISCMHMYRLAIVVITTG